MNGDTISNVLNKCNHYGILFPVNIKKGNKSMLMKDKLLKRFCIEIMVLLNLFCFTVIAFLLLNNKL